MTEIVEIRSQNGKRLCCGTKVGFPHEPYCDVGSYTTASDRRAERARYEQEMLYLDQIKYLFRACGAADRLMSSLRREFVDLGLVRPEMQELEVALQTLEAKKYYDRAAGRQRKRGHSR